MNLTKNDEKPTNIEAKVWCLFILMQRFSLLAHKGKVHELIGQNSPR